MASKREAIAAAIRRRAPGIKITALRHPGAIEGKARDDLLAKWKAGRERRKAIKRQIQEIGDPLPAMIAASRFVVDVNGDPPSLEQLAAVLELAEKRQELQDEDRELQMEGKRSQGQLLRRRCEIVHTGAFGFIVIDASGATWQECIDKINTPT